MKAGILIWLALLVWSPRGLAAEPLEAEEGSLQGFFQAANQAYLDARYDDAVAGYRKLIEAGVVHPDLYYNMANACYRAGNNGLAVLFFEKALALEPSNAAAASNLAAVRKDLIDRVVMPEGGTVGEPLWHGFIRGLSLGWLTWAFLGLWLLVFALGTVRRLLASGPIRRLLFWINVPLVSIVLVMGTLLFARIYVQERVHHGVVIAPTAALREGPGRAAKVEMEIHAGLKVRVLNEVGDHVRVRLANGVEGFIPDRQLGRI